ncbi:hypothetical protein BYT27DRAFT_7208176 [Phlegmacium glaucopus]|nr:hypothetical protein BYT27DRAFT_7208176 [Phlegmacium glaucopus]
MCGGSFITDKSDPSTTWFIWNKHLSGHGPLGIPEAQLRDTCETVVYMPTRKFQDLGALAPIVTCGFLAGYFYLRVMLHASTCKYLWVTLWVTCCENLSQTEVGSCEIFWIHYTFNIGLMYFLEGWGDM